MYYGEYYIETMCVLISNLKYQPEIQYKELLDRLKMTTLKTTRFRGDLIQMFKIKNKSCGIKIRPGS